MNMLSSSGSMAIFALVALFGISLLVPSTSGLSSPRFIYLLVLGLLAAGWIVFGFPMAGETLGAKGRWTLMFILALLVIGGGIWAKITFAG